MDSTVQVKAEPWTLPLFLSGESFCASPAKCRRVCEYRVRYAATIFVLKERDMTSDDWWRVGARLLGVYFVVIGAITATNSLMMFGMGLPDGSNRTVAVLTPVIQGIISAGAGAWLATRSAVRGDLEPSALSDWSAAFRRSTQLLGIFFLITGVSELAKTAIVSYFVGVDWVIRTSQVASGLVNATAGAVLAVMPSTIAQKLDGVRR